jgi:hypothetical protein
MKYISCQRMIGGMSGLVHILATKLGMPLSCITPAQQDAKGEEVRRRFILDGLLLCRRDEHTPTPVIQQGREIATEAGFTKQDVRSEPPMR